MKSSINFLFIVIVLFSSTLFSTVELPFTPLEMEVSFENHGQTLRGILTVPAEKSALSTVVLLLHGFLGNKNDLRVWGTGAGLFEVVANELAKNGIISLRFDFRGSGQSEGDWEDTTFSGQISDAVAALDFVQDSIYVDPNRICVVGLSQGGLVGACLAAQDARVKSLALWSPVSIPAYTYAMLLNPKSIEEAMKTEEGVISAAISWGGTTLLKTDFFREFFTIDPLAEIAKYRGPLLVAVGSKDSIVFPQPLSGELYLKYHEGTEQMLVYDTDHIFNLFFDATPIMDLIEKTMVWFEETASEEHCRASEEHCRASEEHCRATEDLSRASEEHCRASEDLSRPNE